MALLNQQIPGGLGLLGGQPRAQQPQGTQLAQNAYAIGAPVTVFSQGMSRPGGYRGVVLARKPGVYVVGRYSGDNLITEEVPIESVQSAPGQ